MRNRLLTAFGIAGAVCGALLVALWLSSCAPAQPIPPPQRNIGLLSVPGITRTVAARVYVENNRPFKDYNRPYTTLAPIESKTLQAGTTTINAAADTDFEYRLNFNIGCCYFLMYFRNVDSNNRWMLYHNENGSIALDASFGGYRGTQASAPAGTLVVGQTYNMSLIYSGNHYIVRVNGRTVIDYFDANHWLDTSSTPIDVPAFFGATVTPGTTYPMPGVIIPQNGVDTGTHSAWAWNEIETISNTYTYTAFDAEVAKPVSSVVSIKLQDFDPTLGITNQAPSFITPTLWLSPTTAGCPVVGIPDYSSVTVRERWAAFLQNVGTHLDATPAVDGKIAAVIIHPGVGWTMRPAGVASVNGVSCDYESLRKPRLLEADYAYGVTSTLTSAIPVLKGSTGRAVYVVLGDGEPATRAAIASTARSLGAGILASVNGSPSDAYLYGDDAPWGSLQSADFYPDSLAYAVRWQPPGGSYSDAYYAWQATGMRFPDLLIVAPAWLPTLDTDGLWTGIENTVGKTVTTTKSLKWTAHDKESTADAPGDYSRGLIATSPLSNAAGLWIQPGTVLWTNAYSATAQNQQPQYAYSARMAEWGKLFYFAPDSRRTPLTTCQNTPLAVNYYDNGTAFVMQFADDTATLRGVITATAGSTYQFKRATGTAWCWAPNQWPTIGIPISATLLVSPTNSVPLYLHSVEATLP